MTTEQTLEHILALKYEVGVLKSEYIQPHDTGHVITCVNMLESRIKELYKLVNSKPNRIN